MTRLLPTATAAFMLAVAPLGAQEINLVPHRAVYEMNLAAVGDNREVVGASGSLEYIIRETCVAWEVNNVNHLMIVGADGTQISSRIESITTEAKHGLTFEFRSESLLADGISEQVAGAARIEGAGEPGFVEFADGGRIELPAGVVFPTGHMLGTIRAARAGERLYHTLLYDGAERDRVYVVSTVIGNRVDNAEDPEHPLLAGHYWPVSIAFFDRGAADPGQGVREPEFQVSGPIYANGVSGDLLITYDNFTIRARLNEIEAIDRPEC